MNEPNQPRWTLTAHQERHHHTRSFEEELVSLLKKNELEFEEKYLWS